MTRIALLHYSAPPIVGGVESVLGHQARLMADHGHQVRIIAGRGNQTDSRIPFVRVPLADSRDPKVLAIKTELDAGRVPPEFDEIVQALTVELYNKLAGVEILIAHNICSLNKNLALTAAVHNLLTHNNLRIILWHHDLARQDELQRHHYPWKLLSEGKEWRGAMHVTISEPRQSQMAERFGIDKNDIQVIPNGIDIARFHKLEEQTRGYIQQINFLDACPLLLLPARITRRKNIQLALHVCASLVERFPDMMLMITGPLGPHNPANAQYLDELIALRQELKLVDHVCFLTDLTKEHIPDQVISDFYHLADALFLTSSDEGFGIPILEASLANLPIFCPELPPLLDRFGEKYLNYFKLNDNPETIATMIYEYLSLNPVYQLRKKVRSEYTWEGIYTRYIAPLLVK